MIWNTNPSKNKLKTSYRFITIYIYCPFMYTFFVNIFVAIMTPRGPPKTKDKNPACDPGSYPMCIELSMVCVLQPSTCWSVCWTWTRTRASRWRRRWPTPTSASTPTPTTSPPPPPTTSPSRTWSSASQSGSVRRTTFIHVIYIYIVAVKSIPRNSDFPNVQETPKTHKKINLSRIISTYKTLYAKYVKTSYVLSYHEAN
jgi:hypothetical protein